MTNTSIFGVTRAPARILFGSGQFACLPALAAEIGKNMLICTDSRFVATAAFAKMRAGMEGRGLKIHVFDRTEPELPLHSVQACLEELGPVDVDGVIGIGGGSCLDMAKLVALGKSHGADFAAFYGENRVPAPVLPLIAVPTTAGTGSEVTPVAVLADDRRDMKVGISSRFLIPAIALCDPDLTLTCPPGLTAVSGSDAMTHAIEAFTACRKPNGAGLEQDTVFVGKNRLSDLFATEAIGLIAKALPVAVADGANVRARSDMLYGALLAGLAFGSAGTSAAHAIQYPIGALTHTAHGLGVAALLPYCMAFNRSVCTEEFAFIAKTLGGQGDETTLADAAPGRVAALFEGVGIPKTLDAIGVKPEDSAWIAERAMGAKRLVDNNPRPFSEAGIATILRAGFAGDLTIPL